MNPFVRAFLNAINANPQGMIADVAITDSNVVMVHHPDVQRYPCAVICDAHILCSVNMVLCVDTGLPRAFGAMTFYDVKEAVEDLGRMYAEMSKRADEDDDDYYEDDMDSLVHLAGERFDRRLAKVVVLFRSSEGSAIKIVASEENRAWIVAEYDRSPKSDDRDGALVRSILNTLWPEFWECGPPTVFRNGTLFLYTGSHNGPMTYEDEVALNRDDVPSFKLRLADDPLTFNWALGDWLPEDNEAAVCMVMAGFVPVDDDGHPVIAD